jgi:hypothetical protein
MTSSSGDVTKRDFYLDGACSAHVCNRRDVFQTFLPLKEGVRKVNGFEGSEKSAKGIGTIRLPMRLPGGKVSYAVIQNVLYIPESVNLISQGMIMDRGIWIDLINGCGANLYSNPGEMVATAPQIHRMLPFAIAWEHMPRSSDAACAVSTSAVAPGFPEDSLLFSSKATGQTVGGDAKLKLWHRRLADIGVEALKCLPDAAERIPTTLGGACDCHSCLRGEYYIPTTLGGACDCHSCLRGEYSRKLFTPLPLGNRAVGD